LAGCTQRRVAPQPGHPVGAVAGERGALAKAWPLLLAELTVGLTYALAGFVLFSWFEAQAKPRGTLEAF